MSLRHLERLISVAIVAVAFIFIGGVANGLASGTKTGVCNEPVRHATAPPASSCSQSCGLGTQLCDSPCNPITYDPEGSCTGPQKIPCTLFDGEFPSEVCRKCSCPCIISLCTCDNDGIETTGSQTVLDCING